MRELSKTEQKVLNLLDDQIQELQSQLEPYQELIDQMNRLTKTKATLLNERVGNPRSAANGYTQLTHEQVTQAFKSADTRYLSVSELSRLTGAPDSTVRSHLNRGRGSSYKRHKEDGTWRMIGDTSS